MTTTMNISRSLRVLQDPLKINEAVYASSPEVLTFALERDPNVRALINAGPAAATAIAQLIKEKGGQLHELSLACFAYIVDRIDKQAVGSVFGPVLGKLADQPNSFATILVVHALQAQRQNLRPDGEYYFTPAEIKEALRRSKKGERK